jgi:hypothetical protein
MKITNLGGRLGALAKGKAVTRSLTTTRMATFATVKLPQADLGLKERDPEMAKLLNEEIERQKKGVLLLQSFIYL